LLDQGHAATDIAGALFTLLRGASSREGQEIPEDRPQYERSSDRREGGKFEKGKGGKTKTHERLSPTPEEGMTRLFLSLGKSQGAQPGEIAGMLYREGGLPDGAIGKIALFPRHSLIDIRSDLADAIIEATRHSKLRGKPFRLAHDRK
jgi:ATP-dependent RNA helicase DeaD